MCLGNYLLQMKKRSVLLLVVGLIAISGTSNSEAQDSAHFSWAAGPQVGAVESYTFGVGARIGYTWNFGLYTAYRFDYFLGTLLDLGINSTTRYSIINSLDLGYEINFDPFRLIPVIGLGVGALHDGSTSAFARADIYKFAFSPGIAAYYRIRNRFNIGIETHWSHITTHFNSMTFGATFGMDFGGPPRQAADLTSQ